MRVHSDVTILDGVTLTITAGTFVAFEGNTGLQVQGRLLALGDPWWRVRFDAAGSRGDASWQGITFFHTPETNEPSLLRFCEITRARGGSEFGAGGALTFVGFSRCRVENSILRDNAAVRGGAVYCSHFAAPELVGCLITGNEAALSGSALYCLDAYPRLINCTITGNTDLNPEPVDRAAAVVGMISKPALINCVVWNNASNYFLDETVIQAKAPYVQHNDIQFGHPGDGNIDGDPEFVMVYEPVFGLLDSSPCLEAGVVDTTGLRLPALDLAGQDRVQWPRVDMGCYEGGHVICAVPGGDLPPESLLAPNYPNPFNPRTTVAMTLPGDGAVFLRVFDASGRLVRTLIGGEHLAAGPHEITWLGRDDAGRLVPSGVYFCSLQCGDHAARRRMMLVR